MPNGQIKIGVTERGDGGLDQSWRDKLDKVDAAIVITKDCTRLIDPLPDKVLVHCTITGLGGTILEPNVPDMYETVTKYKELVKRYGGKRIILRIDPIFPFGWMLEMAKKVLAIASPAQGDRIRVSFVDLYKHVRQRLPAEIKIPYEGTHATETLRRSLWYEFGYPEVCGEPGFDCVGCVSNLDLEAVGLDVSRLSGKRALQRQICHCAAEKTELLNVRGQCPMGCLYCYWWSASVSGV